MGYELSWLDAVGKPEVSGLLLRVPCTSPNMVESKSLKLYLNSLAQDRFANRSEVRGTLMADLGSLLASTLIVDLMSLDDLAMAMGPLPGRSLDRLAVKIAQYERDPDLLRQAGQGRAAAETWHTHLFRSLCPMTGQPDWASMLVAYEGPGIEPSALLAYLVSYRGHAGFHEDLVEQVFLDIQERCRPQRLTVCGHFLRRGGLNINPFRSTEQGFVPVRRLARQ